MAPPAPVGPPAVRIKRSRIATDGFEIRMGGYVHQDWPLDYRSPAEAVHVFQAGASDALLAQARAALASLLVPNPDEESLAHAVHEAGGHSWRHADGGTYAAWLSRVAALRDDDR